VGGAGAGASALGGRRLRQAITSRPRLPRELRARLNEEARVSAYVVEAQNFESIHDHSAYAPSERDQDD